MHVSDGRSLQVNRVCGVLHAIGSSKYNAAKWAVFQEAKAWSPRGCPSQ